MEDLIKRLESAEGPSRELDEHICVTIQGVEPGSEGWRLALKMNVPGYTGSLDAALTLVPEGWGYIIASLNTGYGRAYVAASLTEPDPPSLAHMTAARTPALALCISSLRAREK